MPSTGSTSQRGYGHAHQKLRASRLADLAARPGQPCGRCGEPMYVGQALDLDHTEDRTGYRGLAHERCNRSAGGRRGGRRSRQRAQPSTLRTSRAW